MSLSVTATLPSCTSLGCTNSMEPNMPNSFRRMAHTSPSKSLRVRSLCFFGLLLIVSSALSSAESSQICSERTLACSVHTRVNACWHECQQGMQECAMSLGFRCHKHIEGLMLLEAQPCISPKLRNEQNRRSHECERGTQESERHVL